MQNRIPMTGADSPEALMRQQAPWEYGLSGAFPVDVSGYQPALPMTNILKQILPNAFRHADDPVYTWIQEPHPG